MSARESEIRSNILELPTIRERDVAKIQDFYEKPLKLNELNAAARFTLDKLEVIKNELALIDGNWRDWTFKEFLKTLEKWTINNPLQGGRKQKAFFNREERMHMPQGGVYCTSTEHRAVNCTKVTDVSQQNQSSLLNFYASIVWAHTEQHYARAKHLVTLARENITRQSVKNRKCYRRHANQA